MTAAYVATADRPEPAGQRPSDAQWAAIDWCARLRPAIWLHAAGFVSDAEQLRRHRPVDGTAALDAIWPAVSRSAADALAARQGCWRELATAVRRTDEPAAVEVSVAMASIGWPSAVAAAGHLAVPATRFAGFPDPARVLFRTFTVTDEPGAQWDQAWDVPRDAACIVTCRALHGLLPTAFAIWTATPGRAWALMDEAIRRALAPVRTELTQAATRWMERGW